MPEKNQEQADLSQEDEELLDQVWDRVAEQERKQKGKDLLKALKPKEEAAFQKWYAGHAVTLKLNSDPDDPRHHYDYRAAFKAGVKPDEAGHWPSRFKTPDHPNRFIDGVNTITGKKVTN